MVEAPGGNEQRVGMQLKVHATAVLLITLFLELYNIVECMLALK